jgi:cysteine desulfurase
VLLAVGLGKACELAADLSTMDGVRVLRDLLWGELTRRLTNRVALNGHPDRRLPNTLNIAFPGQLGPSLLQRLDGIAASTGSACHSGRMELSPVLKAMGVPPEIGMGTIRLSLGRGTTRAEIDEVVERLAHALDASP